MIFTLAFWKDAIIRAVKTFAQSAVAVLAAGATGLLGTDWIQLLSVAGLAAVVSLLTSIASGDSIGTAYALAATTTSATPVESNPATVAAVTQPDVAVTDLDAADELSDDDITRLAATIPVVTDATEADAGATVAA
jgi:aspartate-semialdehyde dehydrogenase